MVDVLREGLRLVVIGLPLGLAAALAAVRLLSSYLYGVSATDAATFSTMTAVLAGVALFACYVPAARDARRSCSGFPAGVALPRPSHAGIVRVFDFDYAVITRREKSRTVSGLAAAWSALADCHIIRAIRGMAPPAEASARATAAARRALELDPSLADAHASLGIVQTHTGQLQAGIRSLRRAIDLNPGLAMAHNLMARALYSFERHDEALAAARTSVGLDPLSVLIHTALGDAYYFARQYEKAVLSYRYVP